MTPDYREVENELQSTLEDLRAYRKRDPRFERAIEAVVEAEATAAEDPAEGKVAGETGRRRVGGARPPE